MLKTINKVPHTCTRCLRADRRRNALSIAPGPLKRSFSCLSPLNASQTTAHKVVDAEDPEVLEAQILSGNKKNVADKEKSPGAMSRRLAEATENAVLEGGRAGRKAVEEAGFSDELKARLLEKVEAQKFQSENASVFAQVGLSSSAGRGVRDIAAAQPWQGSEASEDAVLRMLSDAHKPLKPASRAGRITAPVVDLRIKRQPKASSGQRLANARDQTTFYASAKDSQMSDKERENLRNELKERFMPASRAMPTSFTGLAALANERIEDAIARGQFKNIPRGKAVERDARADNPFIDTTEYIMNKMIQRQDIVPPWIEKQQELVKTANSFRGRLRFDWKRHAARTIASRGGSLQEQVQTANLYAESERLHNPKRRAVEQISVPTNYTDDPVMVKITQEAPATDNSNASSTPIQISLETKDAEIAITEQPLAPASEIEPPAKEPLDRKVPVSTPLPSPLRDPEWEKAEMSYLTLAISNLNNLSRSYNLMAPDLAKKPYFSLDRELKSCYADVAPELGAAIIERARRPEKELVEKIGHRPGGVMERFAGEYTKIYEEKKKPYGFREFWDDLWRKDGAIR